MPNRPLNPKKLLLSKWTAAHPMNKQKHFLVSKLIQPNPSQEKIEFIEIEAIYSKQTQIIRWRELENLEVWVQGWQ